MARGLPLFGTLRTWTISGQPRALQLPKAFRNKPKNVQIAPTEHFQSSELSRRSDISLACVPRSFVLPHPLAHHGHKWPTCSLRSPPLKRSICPNFGRNWPRKAPRLDKGPEATEPNPTRAAPDVRARLVQSTLAPMSVRVVLRNPMFPRP